MEPKPILLFDEQQRVTAVSPPCAALLGITSGPIVGLRCRDAFSCPCCIGNACPLQQALDGESAEGLLPCQVTGRPLSVSSSPVIGPDGGRLALLQLRREEEPEELAPGAGLQPVLDSLREILRSDLAAVAVYDTSRKEVRWQVTSGSVSPSTTGIRLRSGQGFAGRIVMTGLPLRTFRFPQDLTADPNSYPIFLAEGLHSAIGVPLRAGEQVLGVLMVARRQEEDYSEADLDRLDQVSGSISLAAEMMQTHEHALRRERARLAQEVHDGLSQNLFGLQLMVFDLQHQLRSDQPEALERGLKQTCGLLDETLGEVRRLITDLRSGARMQVGLISALSDHLGSFYRLTGLPVEFAVNLDPGEEIDRPDVHEVLRIVQEALMNVYRHAAASRVRVEVSREDKTYRILIEDDGRGFDPDATRPEGHFGLAIMEERTARLKANLQITSETGRGSIIILWLPV